MVKKKRPSKRKSERLRVRIERGRGGKGSYGLEIP